MLRRMGSARIVQRDKGETLQYHGRWTTRKLKYALNKLDDANLMSIPKIVVQNTALYLAEFKTER
jgi:hypothetical protein